jgi:hypothetical protein
MHLLVLLLLQIIVLNPNATPVDVPPIQEEYGTVGTEFCDMGQCSWVDYVPDSPMWEGMKPHRRTRETCADKKRFLMTSEDGVKHCIKLGN